MSLAERSKVRSWKLPGVLGWVHMGGVPYAETLFAIVLFVACAQTLPILGDYNSNSQHPEFITAFFPRVLQHGPNLGWNDLVAGFDVHRFDTLPRPRFLSYELTDLNVKLRLLWMQYFEPHPSVNLAWVLGMLSIPALYRVVLNLTGRHVCALLALAVYVPSAGFMSGLTLLFHAAKPLANFTLIAVFLFASEIFRRGLTLLVDAPRKLIVGLLTALFLGSISDELGAVGYFVVAVCFFRLFVPYQLNRPTLRRAAVSVGLVAIPLLGFVILILLTPLIDLRLFGYPISMFDIFLGSTSTLPADVKLLSMTFDATLGPSIFTGEDATTVVLGAVVGALVVFGCVRPSGLTGGLVVVISLYFVYACALANKSADVQGQFYYGCVFSVLYAVLLSVAASEVLTACSGRGFAHVALRLVASVGLAGLVLASIRVERQQFDSLNIGWIQGDAANTYQVLATRYPGLTARATSSAEVSDLWQRWRDGEDVPRTYRGSYLNIWLLNEMDRRSSCCVDSPG